MILKSLMRQLWPEGEALGIKTMREVVCATLSLMSKNKATEFVIKNIREGVEFNSNVVVKYTAFQMNVSNCKLREANHDKRLKMSLVCEYYCTLVNINRAVMVERLKWCWQY